MADYFTNFSLVLKLENETEQAYALNLAHKASLMQQGDELPADFPKDLVDLIEATINSGGKYWARSMVCCPSMPKSRSMLSTPIDLRRANSFSYLERKALRLIMGFTGPVCKSDCPGKDPK